MSKDNKTATAQQDNASSATPASTQEKLTAPAVQPLTDVYESKEGATLYVDLPGVNKQQLDIDVDQNVLTIKGYINLDTPDDLSPTYMDIRSKRFERRFTLGEELDSSRIEARLNQGELTLFIPRSEQHKPYKIEVKTA